MAEKSKAKAKAKTTKVATKVSISRPKFAYLKLRLNSTAPLFQNKFSTRKQDVIKGTQEEGPTSKTKRVREARDFEADWQEATHRGPKGEYGFPASALRRACIDVCRLVGFTMTLAKMSIFVEHDFVGTDGTPLVRLRGDKPVRMDHTVRNRTGVVDIRARPMFAEWNAVARIRFDTDQFTPSDVLNLMIRVGIQCGIGEGRPFSKDSCGMGWGTFDVKVEGTKRGGRGRACAQN